jgi:ATP-dependent Clp protease adapter protein ClpS
MTLTVVNDAATLAAAAGITELRGPFMLASLGAIRDKSSPLRAALAPSGFSLLSYRHQLAHGKVEDPTPPSDGPARVVFHNDPFTPMDLVEGVLTSIFERSAETAREIVRRVHETGSAALAAMDAREALAKVQAARERAVSDEMPLRMTIESLGA